MNRRIATLLTLTLTTACTAAFAQSLEEAQSPLRKAVLGHQIGRMSTCEYPQGYFMRVSAVPTVGDIAPDFTLKDTKGETFSLKSLRGKVVLLDFFATWCPPCKKSIPFLVELHKSFKEKGVVILGINDEDAEALADFGKEKGVTYPLLVDKSKDVHRAYGIRAVPSLFVLDAEGRIVSTEAGFGEEIAANLLKNVDAALKTIKK
ncbi:MAG: TlpA disulfide reductase family protein [Elusimicrobiota bacterium]|jgi:peroxiredoxin